LYFSQLAACSFGSSRLFFAPRSLLLNHPVGSLQHGGRDRQADLFGGFQIDEEFKLRGLRDRKLSRFGPRVRLYLNVAINIWNTSAFAQGVVACSHQIVRTGY
jgi:hypothetical protein